MANSRAALSRAGSMAVLNITLPELPPGYLEVLKGTLDVQAKRSPRGMPPRRVSISLPTLALRPAKSSEEDTSVNEQPMPLDLAEPREGERRRRRHKRTPKEPKGTMNFEQASLRPGCLSDRLTAYLPTCLSTSQPVWPSHCPTPPHPSRRPTPPDPTSYYPTSPHNASPYPEAYPPPYPSPAPAPALSHPTPPCSAPSHPTPPCSAQSHPLLQSDFLAQHNELGEEYAHAATAFEQRHTVLMTRAERLLHECGQHTHSTTYQPGFELSITEVSRNRFFLTEKAVRALMLRCTMHPALA